MQPAQAFSPNATTFLTHLVGLGLADERYVVQRFKSMLDGDIRPVEAEASKAGRRRTAKRVLASLKQVKEIVDELGYIPLSQTGSELLFDVFSRRYENGATIVTSNLPFQEWTTVFASERLTGALLDRITHHVHILEMNGESYRLKQSRSRRRQPSE